MTVVTPGDDRVAAQSVYRRRFYEAIGAAMYIKNYVEEKYPLPSGSVAAVLPPERIEAMANELQDLTTLVLDIVPVELTL